MQYPTECPSIEAFIQRVVILSSKGYYYFHVGRVPERKSRVEVDEKMISKYLLKRYGCRALKKASRSRRRSKGFANIDYFRFHYGFIVMATEGMVAMSMDDPDELADFREQRVVFGDYQVSIVESGFTKGGAPRAKVRVELRDEVFQALRREFLALATCRMRGWLESEFYNLPYNCYRGIRVQLRSILDEMNGLRRKKGQKKLNPICIRFKRDLPKHFEAEEDDRQRAA